jgi:predicted ArsR family transcriptional regulator
MKPNERLVMMALKDGPLSLRALCENTGISDTNIYRYLDRLKRAHQIVMQKEYCGEDGKTWIVYPKRGYLHDPHSQLEIAYYDPIEEETPVHS